MAKATRDRIGAGDVQDLAVAVEQLTEETRILRTAIDELRDDVVWAARQVLSAGDFVAPGRELCRQRDPLAPDTDLRTNAPASTEHDESQEYCCAAPRLVWSGDVDSPGVECRNCGYVVAECGEVVSYRPHTSNDDDRPLPAGTRSQPDAPPEAASRQGLLWRSEAE